MYLGEVAAKRGIDMRKDTKLRVGLLGGEPWSDRMRDRIHERLGIKAVDIYGTSELSGPLWCECSEQKGMHVWGDMTLVEVLDPRPGSLSRRGRRGSW